MASPELKVTPEPEEHVGGQNPPPAYPEHPPVPEDVKSQQGPVSSSPTAIAIATTTTTTTTNPAAAAAVPPLASQPQKKQVLASAIVNDGFRPEENPYETANIFSQFTFWWLNPIFWKGYRNPLQKSDIWRAGRHFDADLLSKEMGDLWDAEVEKKTAKGEEPSLKDVVMKFVRPRIFWGGVAKFLSDVAQVMSPLVLKYLLNYIYQSYYSNPDNLTGSNLPPQVFDAFNANYNLTGKGFVYPLTSAQATVITSVNPTPTMAIGFGYVMAMFCLGLVNSLGTHYFFQSGIVAGIQARTAVAAMIYRKGLKLSVLARQDFTSGKIINLVSTDCQRIELFMMFYHVMWAAPIQILLILALMISQIGVSALAGVGLIFLLAPAQGVLFKRLGRIRGSVAPIADKRIRLIQELLSGIKVIKFFTWEDPFLSKIEDLRVLEMKQVFKKNSLNAIVMAVIFGVPVLASSLCFVIYGLTNALNPSIIFPTLTWFGILRFPLMFLPNVLVGAADFKVAMARISKMLIANELKDEPLHIEGKDYSVVIENGNFEWEAPREDELEGTAKSGGPGAGGGSRGPPSRNKSKKYNKKKDAAATDATVAAPTEEKPKEPGFKMSDINVRIPRGSLTAIVGAVGSGKSSLLHAIIGEMRKTSGDISLDGRVGYAAQQAWIQNATVEKNVTFGLEYDETRYANTIKACCLERDLEVFPDGDQTEIGERGINLSGGQKQRVNLARCMYFDTDIILMDDPLSAVDAHVGRDLFENCISKALKGKTRLLVTHQLHFLPKVDYVIVMDHGKVAEQGSYDELIAKEGEFSRLMTSYGGVEKEDESSSSQQADTKEVKEKEEAVANEGLKAIKDRLHKYHDKAGKELMTVEERETGTVKWDVWKAYITAGGGIPMLMLVLVALGITTGLAAINNYWLVYWTNYSIPAFGSNNNLYIAVYWGFSIAQTIGTFVLGLVFAFVSTAAARSIHKKAIKRIVKAPMSFFDTTPLGRIINRFSKDQDQVDSTLSDSVRMFLNTMASALSSFIIIIIQTPWFAAALVPLIIMYYFVQEVYRCAVRELKRLDSISRSPLFAHFGETMTGLSTIRAYNEQARFTKICDDRLTDTNSPYFLLMTAQRWLGMRVELVGNLMVFFAGTFAIISRTTVSPANVGLSLSYALQVTGVLNWCIRQFAETEVAMNSVERLDYYAARIPNEAPAVIESNRPPSGWPEKGVVEFKGMAMRYTPELPIILRNISLNIASREKIGIVGRTGSGKSSLMQALFRMIEPCEGSVVIDGVDIGKIGLKDLRSRLAIIPQDPVLFSGSFRSNLDPFNEYQDVELWDALTRSNLKEKVASGKDGLEGHVDEGGENLSVGQRQLLCLARAMLRKPKILVMDEATANVDYETDTIIQKSLREDFASATILTIAHRLNTIIDYDKVLVLQAGNIGEYASPAQLLASEDGMFTSMVNETGPTNSDLLKKLAKSAAEGSIKVEDLVNAGGIVATAAASEDVKDAVEV